MGHGDDQRIGLGQIFPSRQLQPVFGVNSISSEGRYSSAVVLRPSEKPRYMPCRQRGFSSALGRALGARKWE